MDYRIKVKAYVSIDEIDYQLDTSTIIEVEVSISENKWKNEMEILVEEIECNLEDEEFYAESEREDNIWVDFLSLIESFFHKNSKCTRKSTQNFGDYKNISYICTKI